MRPSTVEVKLLRPDGTVGYQASVTRQPGRYAVPFPPVAPAMVQAGQAGDGGPPQAQAQAAEKPYLVHTVVHRPRRQRTLVRHFTPPAHPTPGYVFGVIIPAEAARWHASAATLERRVSCESHGDWWATNGLGRRPRSGSIALRPTA